MVEEEKLIERLMFHLKHMSKEEMDSISWRYEEGIIISGNDAKIIVNALKKIINLNNKEKEK